jgi:hypothetical protein
MPAAGSHELTGISGVPKPLPETQQAVVEVEGHAK